MIVTYELRSKALADFLRLARSHAAHTLKEAPGCLQYDVVLVSEVLVIFYEQYTSMAAFRNHQASASLAEFRLARAPLVEKDAAIVGSLIDIE